MSDFFSGFCKSKRAFFFAAFCETQLRGNDGTFFKKYSLSTMSPELGLSPKHLGLLRFHNQPGVNYEKVGQVQRLRISCRTCCKTFFGPTMSNHGQLLFQIVVSNVLLYIFLVNLENDN